MNRTAKCIQMLILLKNKNIVSIEELAQKLNTNPRNIREYKKELVDIRFIRIGDRMGNTNLIIVHV